MTIGALHNTPPSFSSHRDWIVDENHSVGERIFAVRTVDPDGDPIRFSLAPALFRDGSSYFRVDPITGEVFLQKSLKGMGGDDLYMYVRADDGHHQAKMEVSIKVIQASHSSPQDRKDELDAAPSKPTISDISKTLPVDHDVNPPPFTSPNPASNGKSRTESDGHEASSNDIVIYIALVAIGLPVLAIILILWSKRNSLEKSTASNEKFNPVSRTRN